MDTKTNHFDVIVIGSGISGGWAAKELCEKGLKTLLLERGRNIEHIKDYPTAELKPWELPTDHVDDIFFADESEHPYIQEQPFTWARGYQVGGRSLIWGRQCYRLSDLEFNSNFRHGVGIDWPIRYKDIEPWYNYVENYIGVSGRAENLKHFPDGDFLPPMELNCIEMHLGQSIKEKHDDRILTIARVANLTKGWNQRGPCMNRNLCIRGCPYGGYFSSNSSTIPAAFSTGNLTLRPFSVVSEIIYDDNTRKAKGVRIIDALTKETFEYFARIIFLNASTIASAAILLNSKSDRFPNGLGNDSGQVGHNLMDHHSSAGAYGVHEGFRDLYYKGRRPCGFTIPRFQNFENDNQKDFVGGYMIHGRGKRREWQDQLQYVNGFGSEFKRKLTTPGPWTVWMAGWGECLPYFENRIVLNNSKKDSWGLPLVSINFSFKENERKMIKDIMSTSSEMLTEAGFKEVEIFNYHKPGGSTVHEMGTARMGNNPETSVLNKFNQIHAVKNVFITDGSCMTSSGCQSPSLTYMALTARAADYAVQELKNGTL